MPTAVTVLQRLNQHRIWVNDNLLAAAAALGDEQRHKVFSIGQGSVWKSLLHMYAAEWMWLEALQGNEDTLLPGDVRGKLPGNQLGEGGIRDFADLQAKWQALQQQWTDYLASLSPAALDEPVYKISAGDSAGTRFVSRRSDGILHICMHAHYTAAQVINILRQLGVEKLPKTMMIWLAWQEGLPPTN